MIFVTTHTYALGWKLGVDEAARELHRQIEHTDNQSLPVVRTIKRLMAIDEVCLWTDSGSTRIAESRSRAFHEACITMQDNNDVWVTCDDDCEATLDTLTWLVEAVRGRPGLCVAPCWCRLSQERLPTINVQLPPIGEGQSRVFREIGNGGRVTPMNIGGMGLVAVGLPAMRHIQRANQDHTYRDTEGTYRLALFMEMIFDGYWLGEDYSFFHRVPPVVSKEALATGNTSHMGRMLDLRLIAHGPEAIEEINDTTPPTAEAGAN